MKRAARTARSTSRARSGSSAARSAAASRVHARSRPAKAILSPIVTFINDYPCPDPTFQPAPGQSLDDFLRIGVAPILDSVTLATAEFDRKPLKVRRVVTKLFSFTGAASLVPFDSCITGFPQLGVSDGFFVFIEPPEPGEHILKIDSVSPFTGTSQGTYNLKIRAKGQ